MMLDYQLLFSNAQAITSTAASTNIIDLRGGASATAGTMPAHYGTARYTPFAGNQAELFVQVVTTFTTSDAATLTVKVQTHDDDAFGATTDILLTPLSSTFAVSALVAGYHLKMPIHIPPGWTDRYMRLYYTVGTGTFTAGAITAGLVLSRDTNSYTVAQLT
jgi:hypothetical protein